MSIAAIRIANIIPNHFLVDNLGKGIHPELLDCLKDFFSMSSKAICLDFTSITTGNRRELSQLLQLCISFSENYRKPFFITPTKRLAEYFDYLDPVIFNNYRNPILALDLNQVRTWFGISREAGLALDKIISSDGPISKSSIESLYGPSVLEFLEQECCRGGGYVKRDTDNYIPCLGSAELKSFQQSSILKGIDKSLLDYGALLTCSHYQLNESGLHTDTLLVVDDALSQSSRAVEYLLHLFNSQSAGDPYTFVACSTRLQSIATLIEGALERPVLIVDTSRNSHAWNNESRFHVPPPGSVGLVLEPVCRSGNTISKIAAHVSGMDLSVESAYCFFAITDSIWIESQNFFCRSLIQLDIGQWLNDNECPLCMLGVDFSPIALAELNNVRSRYDTDHPSTLHHFWADVIRTESCRGGCKSHLCDSSDHSFLDYINIHKLLADDKASNRIVRHLYMNLLASLRRRKIRPQSIRYILYKDGDGSHCLANKLSEMFDGWIATMAISPEHVEQMQLDPTKWDCSLRDLSGKLHDKYVILVDDGINRGWTVGRFHSFFSKSRIHHVATVVLLNRLRPEEQPAAIFRDLVEYYHCALPVWHHNRDCPICMKTKFLTHVATLHTPDDIRLSIENSISRYSLSDVKCADNHD